MPTIERNNFSADLIAIFPTETHLVQSHLHSPDLVIMGATAVSCSPMVSLVVVLCVVTSPCLSAPTVGAVGKTYTLYCSSFINKMNV